MPELIKFPSRCELYPRTMVHTKQLNRFGQLKKKKKSLGPKKALLASFLFGSHCLSCSWLEFGSQDTFSQFPFLLFLELCCRIVGNTDQGRQPARIPPLPGEAGVCLRPHVCSAPTVPCSWCCFLHDDRPSGILHSDEWRAFPLGCPSARRPSSPSARPRLLWCLRSRAGGHAGPCEFGEPSHNRSAKNKARRRSLSGHCTGTLDPGGGAE